FTEYQREVTEAEMSWERFARSIKEPLAATVIVAFKWLKTASDIASFPGQILGDLLFSKKANPVDVEMGETQGWGYGATMSRRAHEQEQAAITRNDQLVARAKAADENSKPLEMAEKKLDGLQSQLKTGVMPSVNEPVLSKSRATANHRQYQGSNPGGQGAKGLGAPGGPSSRRRATNPSWMRPARSTTSATSF